MNVIVDTAWNAARDLSEHSRDRKDSLPATRAITNVLPYITLGTSKLCFDFDVGGVFAFL